MTDKERIEAINAAFSGDAMSDTLQLWEEDRNALRVELVSLCQSEFKQQFTTFWTAGESEVKTALLLTALEDAANGTFGEMLPLVCPELQEPADQIDKALISLIDKVCASRENIGVTFPVDASQGVIQKPLADKWFKVMRSCLLLSFCWAIMEVYRNYIEEENNEDYEDKEEVNV